MNRIFAIVAGIACCSAVLRAGQQKSAQQCAAEIRQRHAAIASSLGGHSTSEIAQAIVASDAKNPSVARCAGRRSGGGDEVSSAMSDNSSGSPQLDADANAANKSADKTVTEIDTTQVTFAPPPQVPNPNKKKLLIGGAAAAGGLTAILVAHGGGGSTPSGGTTSGGTTGGGGTSPTPTPTPTDFSGSYAGEATNTKTTCASLTPPFAEHATLTKQGSAYTVVLSDNPSFGRSFVMTPDAQGNYSATGTAPFNSSETYTGTLSVVGGAPTMTLNETSNFGTCSSTNASTLTKQ